MLAYGPLSDAPGTIFVLVESEGDVGPNTTDTSFQGGYLGRRVKVSDVALSNANGDDLSPQVSQESLSASAVFDFLRFRAVWADGDDEELDMIHIDDIHNLNLAPLLPKVYIPSTSTSTPWPSL